MGHDPAHARAAGITSNTAPEFQLEAHITCDVKMFVPTGKNIRRQVAGNRLLNEIFDPCEKALKLIVVHPMPGIFKAGDLGVLEMLDATVFLRIGCP